MIENWSKTSWKRFTAKQQPIWENPAETEKIKDQLSLYPPLVFAGEIRQLRKQLSEVAKGKAFILQAGDCAESFAECRAETIRETLKVILSMAVTLTYAGEKPLIKIARMAGQYAKPRSSDFEERDGKKLPSYRGDIVNRNEFTEEARRPNPENIKKAYYKAAATLNLLRGFTRGGYASLHNTHKWNKDFLKNTEQGQKYEKLADDIDKALAFMNAIGLNRENSNSINEVKVFTSHEALLMEYEEALTRQDTLTNEWYDCSAHMIWIGDRTRQLDGAHIEFLRGVNNPLGIKVGPNHDIDEIIKILERLNPENELGKICLISRMGNKKITEKLPGLARGIQKAGQNVIWCCDPMHGNTFSSANGFKTRAISDIFQEIEDFFSILHSEKQIPGGVHIELTGLDVTECIGGDVRENDLSREYATKCDPRLNAKQSIELAFKIAEKIHR